MIIEIKDLPNQKIKKIHVDIEFDDSDNVSVLSDISPEIKIPDSNKKSTKKESVINKDDELREKKEIPDEMKDMEF